MKIKGGFNMENCCTPACMGIKLLILGIILIVNQYYFKFDIWMVIGVLLIIKAIIMFIMPVCACNKNKKK